VAGDIQDIDRGWDDIKKKMRSADRSFTKVGLPFNVKVNKGSGGGSKGKRITESFKLIDVALVQEFGSKDGRIPPRAAIRQAFDTNIRKITDFQIRIYDGLIADKLNVRQGLGLLGEFMTGKIKRQITTLRSPPNKDSTKKRKGSSNPLIDHSQYRNSVTHVEVIL